MIRIYHLASHAWGDTIFWAFAVLAALTIWFAERRCGK